METYRFGYRVDESHEYVLLLSGACKWRERNPFVRDSTGIMPSKGSGVLLTIGIEQLQAILDAIVGLRWIRFRVLLDEANKGGTLDLNGLAGAIVERNHKVKEVGLAQIAGRLLLEVGAADAQAAIRSREICVCLKQAYSRAI